MNRSKSRRALQGVPTHRFHCSPLVITLLLLTTSLAGRPALAEWPPDSVLTIGDTGNSRPLGRTAFLPAGVSDFYVVWVWSQVISSEVYESPGVSRVTTEGGLTFSNATGLRSVGVPGIAADGTGGLIDAWTMATVHGFDVSENIAYRRMVGDGTVQPGPLANYLAAESSALCDSFPAVATDPSGGAYIVWFRGLGGYALQRVTTAGTAAPGWPADGLEFTPAQLYSFAGPALLPDGSGGTYVLFQNDCARVVRVASSATLAPGWPADGVPMESVTGYGTGEYPSDLSLVSSNAERTFAVWSEADPINGGPDKRIMVRRFEATGVVDGEALVLTPFTPGIAGVVAQSDGQGGLLLSWYQSGEFEVAHVLADGTVAAGPFAVTGFLGGAVAPSHDGGFIVFRAESVGIVSTWYLANGGLDPSEPQNPRLVHPRDTSGAPDLYPVAARSDGDGGAFLVWGEGGLPFHTKAKMRHVFSTGALAVGTPPRPSRLAFSLAPNPARSELTVDLSLATDGPASIELLDVSGRRLLAHAINVGPSARAERLQLPAGITSGIYFARVTQGPDIRVRRFAVIL